MPSATIKLFLQFGDPKSLRTAEISNWSGKAIAAPRTEFDKLLARDELNQAGVYILTGVDPDSGEPMAYIGEGEVLKDRIKQQRTKDFWISAFVFVSKDENLTKSHIRYLEGRLINDAAKIGRYKLDNLQSSGSRLPESDREDMEMFLEKIHQLLPVLGSELITPLTARRTSKDISLNFFCTIKGLTAHGQRTPNGFVVFKNSQAVLKHRPEAEKYARWILNLRSKLINEGSLVEMNGALVFMKDVEFSSPSAAAGVVRGGTAAGPIRWKTEEGKTLKQIEESVT